MKKKRKKIVWKRDKGLCIAPVLWFGGSGAGNDWGGMQQLSRSVLWIAFGNCFMVYLAIALKGRDAMTFKKEGVFANRDDL